MNVFRAHDRSIRNGRPHYILLGLAAISTFALALPGAALADVTSCPGGTVGVNGAGFPYCVGGANNGQLVVSGPQPASSTPSTTPGFHFSPSTFPPFDRVNQGSGGDTALDSAKALAELTILSGLTSRNGGGQLQDNHLGMYVNGGLNGDATLGGGGYSLRDSGVSISDTAGLIVPGTNSPNYRENSGMGGLSGTYDASRFVGSSQHLFFNGAFDYTNSNTNFGGAGAGSSINGENYLFTGTLYIRNKTPIWC